MLLKWQPYQYNAKYEKNASFTVVFTGLLSKILRENYIFNINFQNSYEDILFGRIQDLNYSAIKTAALTK